MIRMLHEKRAINVINSKNYIFWRICPCSARKQCSTSICDYEIYYFGWEYKKKKKKFEFILYFFETILKYIDPSRSKPIPDDCFALRWNIEISASRYGYITLIEILIYKKKVIRISGKFSRIYRLFCLSNNNLLQRNNLTVIVCSYLQK